VMVRAGTTERYVPPTTGKLFLVVGDSYTNRGLGLPSLLLKSPLFHSQAIV
jgi:hypothetical protein